MINNTRKKLTTLILPLLFVCVLGVMPTILNVVTQPAYADETKDSSSKDESDADKDKEKEKDTSSSTSSASGDYSKLQIPSRIATAYHDAYIEAQADSNGDKFKVLDDNITKILQAQNKDGNVGFANVGALYGSISLSNSSSTSNITQVASADKQYILSKLGGANGAGNQYWQFGKAYTNLVSKANSTSPSTVGAENVVSGLSGTASVVANLGITLLQKFSPAPIVLALADSSVLTDPAYSENLLVTLVNNNGPISGLVKFFGDPAPGFPQISMSVMITISIILACTGLALLSIFLNGRQFGMSMRKTMVKVVVLVLAIPVAAKLYDTGLSLAEGVVENRSNSTTDETLETNLALADWAQGAKFGLPQGVSLHIYNDQFTFTRSDIKALNLYAAYKSDVISASEYAGGSPSADVEKKVAKHIQKSVSKNENVTNIQWSDSIRKDDHVWYTDVYNSVADALGSGTLINESNKSDSDDNPDNSGYLSYFGLYSNDGGTTFQMSPSVDYGLTPVAAFNMMNTTFDQNGFGVKSNLENPSIPTVAPAADTYSSGAVTSVSASEDEEFNKLMAKPSLLVTGVINLTLLIAGLTALVRILTAGFGGVFSGGAGSAFGSASGAGELIGGVIAFILGLLGLSMLIVAMQETVDLIWLLVHDGLSSILGGVNNSIPDGVLDSVRGIKWIGGMLAGMLTSIATALLSLVSLIFLPKLVKIPIEAFGTWIAGFPQMLAAKFQEMENRFTGDYRAGGGGKGNHMANAASKAAAKSQSQRAAMRTGALMMGGAIMKSAITRNSKDSITDPKDNPTTDTPEGVNPEGANETPGNTSEVKDVGQDTKDTLQGADQNNEASVQSEQSSAEQSDTSDSTADSDHSETDGSDEKSVTSQAGINDKSINSDSVKSDMKSSDKQAGPKEESKESSVSTDSEGATAEGSSSENTSESPTTNLNESSTGDSVNSVDSKLNHGGVVDDTNSVNNESSLEGGIAQNQSVSEGNIAESVASDTNAAIDARSTAGDVDASGVSSDQSVNADNISQASSQTESNIDKSKASAVNASTSNQSMTSTGNSASKNANGSTTNKTGQDISSKAGKLASRIGNTSVGAVGKDAAMNVMGAKTGEVGNKEQAAMGAAHMAAGLVGAENVTQRGVDNVNARKGLGKQKSNQTNASKSNTPTGDARDREARIRQTDESLNPKSGQKVQKPTTKSVRNDINAIRNNERGNSDKFVIERKNRAQKK